LGRSWGRLPVELLSLVQVFLLRVLQVVLVQVL
jgi:hypothetical protein